MSAPLKVPCKQDRTGLRGADWCRVHEQSVWSCMAKYRTNMKRAKVLFKKQIELKVKIAQIDTKKKLVEHEN
jgi:hypothetical protein